MIYTSWKLASLQSQGVFFLLENRQRAVKKQSDPPRMLIPENSVGLHHRNEWERRAPTIGVPGKKVNPEAFVLEWNIPRSPPKPD